MQQEYRDLVAELRRKPRSEKVIESTVPGEECVRPCRPRRLLRSIAAFAAKLPCSRPRISARPHMRVFTPAQTQVQTPARRVRREYKEVRALPSAFEYYPQVTTPSRPLARARAHGGHHFLSGPEPG